MENVEEEYGYLRNVEKNYRMDWPSKTSILETPERKRCRRSASFADSGLGSSLFGSPPWKKASVPDTAPPLRTPTRKISPNMNSPDHRRSPLSSFLHISAFSDSFSPPECCSPPSDLRLSDPTKAVEYRFSGSNVPEHRAPINMADEFGAAVPSTSFKTTCHLTACRSLGNQFSRTSTRSPCDDDNDDFVMDASIPYGVLETPSKGFKSEVSMTGSSFDDDGFPLLTSTPIHMAQMDDPSRSYSLFPSHYSVPEQANGPLESSLCEPVDFFREQTIGFIPSVEDIDNDSFVLPPPRIIPLAKDTCLQQKCRPTISNLDRKTAEMNNLPVLPREVLQPNRPFKPPAKALKVNSKKWLQITCGGTPHQMEMTRFAKYFLECGQAVFPH